VLRTEELKRRPARRRNYAAENQALLALAHELTNSPPNLLQRLVQIALDLCNAHSAGISLLEDDSPWQLSSSEGDIRWHAVVGQWAPLVGTASAPRDFGPCGTVVARDCTLLFADAHLHYPELAGLEPLLVEGLFAPLHVQGRAVGTLWVIAHDESRKFDAEDQRLLESLATFAATAYQARAEIVERELAELALRDSQARLAGQSEAFQAAMNGLSLESSLGALVRTAVEWSGGGGIRAGFYLAEPDISELRYVGMATSDAETAEGLEMGPDFLAPGSVVHTGVPAITRDVTTDPRWKPWHWLADKYDFRAVWSFPVQNTGGRAIGTFAMYLREPRDPTPREFELVALLTQAAAMIISRNRAATARDRAEDALRESDRRKNEFLAILAHELRNPLAPIRNAAEILRRSWGDEHKVKPATEMIQRQVGYLVRLVDDLLDVSRISRGKIDLRREPTELGSVVQQAVETMRPTCDKFGHELTFRLPAEPTYMNADPVRLAQVIGNLLNNACKFTEKGGRIRLTVEREGPLAVIRVQDTGIGIAAEQLAPIFDMFTQVDVSLKRSTGGLGLGLTLVKSLVEMHGGTVEARSPGIGRGSEFIVRLPLLSETPPSRLETRAEPVATGGRSILVVDDNRDAAESLATLLRMAGHEVHIAHHGREAIELAASLPVDAILLDIGLPGLDGYEVAIRIREQPRGKDPLLVAVTGWGQEEDRRRSEDAGFDAHLVKPVDFAALTKLLAEPRTDSN
jgi:signal transduction histidine kinase/CheY-like chemotaxis protein